MLLLLFQTGLVTTIAGGGVVGGVASGNTNGIGVLAKFNTPKYPFISASGTIIVPDSNNNIIRLLTPGGIFLFVC